MTEITRILSKIENGSTESIDEVLSAVYFELKQMASAKLANEKAGYSLAATGLVHEAYMTSIRFLTVARLWRKPSIDHTC